MHNCLPLGGADGVGGACEEPAGVGVVPAVSAYIHHNKLNITTSPNTYHKVQGISPIIFLLL